MKVRIKHQRDYGIKVLLSCGKDKPQGSKWGDHFLSHTQAGQSCAIAKRNWRIVLSGRDYAGEVF